MSKNFTAWKGNNAANVTYPSTNVNAGFAAGSTLNADEFNGAFRMMSVVAAAIMNNAGDGNVTPNNSVDDIDTAIKNKIAGIPVNNATTATNLTESKITNISESSNGYFTLLPHIIANDTSSDFPLNFQKIVCASCLNIIATKYQDRQPGIFICPISLDSGTTLIVYTEATKSASKVTVDDTSTTDSSNTKSKDYDPSTLPAYSYGYVFRNGGSISYIGTWTDNGVTKFHYKDITHHVGNDLNDDSTYGWAASASQADSLTIRNANEIFFNTIETEPKDVLVGYRWGNKDLNSDGAPADDTDKAAINRYQFWNSRGVKKDEGHPNGSGSLADVEAKTFIGSKDTLQYFGSVTIYPQINSVKDSPEHTEEDFPTNYNKIFLASLLQDIATYHADRLPGVFICPIRPSSGATAIVFVDSGTNTTTTKVEETVDGKTKSKNFTSGNLPKYSYGYMLWNAGLICYFGTTTDDNGSGATWVVYNQMTEAPGYASEALFPNGFDGKKSEANSNWWKVSALQDGKYVTNWQKSGDDPADPADIAFVQTGDKNQNMNVALDGWYYGKHAYYSNSSGATDSAYMVPAATGAIDDIPDGYSITHTVVAAEEAVTSNKIKIGNTNYTLSLNGTTLTFTAG